MRFYFETLSLPNNVFILLRDLIHERTGLFYDDGKSDLLAEKLSPLVLDRGFGSFLDYYYLLKYDENAASEWGRVMDALSVQETYFWRESDQLDALVQVIVPRFFSMRPGGLLRIWSGVCATGEEPLSIAMALNEAGWFDRARIEINASDASPSAIEKARRGLYRERAFRNLPSFLKRKYFIEESQGVWSIVPELRRRINWSVANLMVEDEIARLATATVIFCRNVFIYFSHSAIEKSVRIFFNHMDSPGFLFLGVSESLFRMNTGFELQEVGGAFVYVKESN
jgi:chemotaxis protein methyltransferase CheR